MTKAYKAKWIIPSDGNIYENCALIVEEGKVQEIVKQENFDESLYSHIKDFGNAVITPGFVNLHNHLQYTDLKLTKKRSLKSKLKKLLSTFVSFGNSVWSEIGKLLFGLSVAKKLLIEHS